MTLETPETVQVITTVEEPPTEDISIIGKDKFLAELLKELNDGKLWRTVKNLAKKFEVDPVQLDKWMMNQTDFARKPGVEEGSVLYAYNSRLTREEGSTTKLAKTPAISTDRPAVRSEHSYAVGQLQLLFEALDKTTRTFAVDVNEISPEAFNHLNLSLKQLESALFLYRGKLQVPVSKLSRG